MSELFIELFSEEIPSNLQINARKQLEDLLKQNLSSSNLKPNILQVFSTPTRLTINVTGLPEIIKIPAAEIKGPKIGVPESVINNYAKSKNLNVSDLQKKETEKGTFYFAKVKEKEISTDKELEKIIPQTLKDINWKKSMKWSDFELNWGRPLISILAIFNERLLKFNFDHLETVNFTMLETEDQINQVKVKTFDDYLNLLAQNEIILDHNKREKYISKKIISICKKKSCKEIINHSLLIEVTNLVDKPNIITATFDKSYLDLPREIIKSTLQTHQRYFTLIDIKDRMLNEFIIVANNKDKKKLIKTGNERVVEARLSDANFFWNRDKSFNLIKQINKLKKVVFYENLGSVYDKTQRLRKMAYFISDQLNINKEKLEIAASVSKSDLVSDLVSEFPELQGEMGKYFALNQGFEQDVSNAISEHYLPTGNSSIIPKKPISYSLSILDKLDNLVGFYLINEKPT
ncbi:MAG: glycine--tRNA ligase subunit beta, partial [Candidatus Pelagibacter sp. TMED196]